MSTDQKIIKNRLGLLELAKQLGNVSQENHAHGHSSTRRILQADELFFRQRPGDRE